MQTENAVAFGGFEYRSRGGEVHRRPIDLAGLNAIDASWLVLNHGENIPSPVEAQLNQTGVPLRFD